MGAQCGEVARRRELRQAVSEVADAGENEFLQKEKLLENPRLKYAGIFFEQGLCEPTSAFATSSGDRTHSTSYPSFSMALTRLRTLPAT